MELKRNLEAAAIAIIVVTTTKLVLANTGSTLPFTASKGMIDQFGW